MAAFYTYYVISRAVDVSVRNIVTTRAELIRFPTRPIGADRETRSSCLVRAHDPDCAIGIDPGDR